MAFETSPVVETKQLVSNSQNIHYFVYSVSCIDGIHQSENRASDAQSRAIHNCYDRFREVDESANKVSKQKRHELTITVC